MAGAAGKGLGWAGRGRSPLKVRGRPVAVSGASRRTAIGPPCAPSRVLWGRFVEPHRTLGFLSRGRGSVRVEEVWVTERRITSNGGPLGSCVDEERRELRYVV